MATLLLVEDNTALGMSLIPALEQEKFRVTWAKNLAEARRATRQEDFTLALLDVGLPDGSGIDFCRELRADGETFPVLFVTANVDEESAVRGLAVGAADYVRKPCGTRELIARIRRSLAMEGGVLERGALSIDADRRTVSVAGRPVPVTTRQFEMLLLLARRCGHVVSREALIAVIDPDRQLSDRTVDSHVSHLRSRLNSAGARGVEIVSVPGIGYRLSLS